MMPSNEQVRCRACGYLESAAGHRASCGAAGPSTPPPSLLADVEDWCANLREPRPLHLLNVRPAAAELAAHPASLAIQAYFAGARHAAGEPPQQFPRPLTDAEAESWHDGWAEHRAEHPEVRRHDTATSTRTSVLGILAISSDSCHARPLGRAGVPAQEAS